MYTAVYQLLYLRPASELWQQFEQVGHTRGGLGDRGTERVDRQLRARETLVVRDIRRKEGGGGCGVRNRGRERFMGVGKMMRKEWRR